MPATPTPQLALQQSPSIEHGLPAGAQLQVFVPPVSQSSLQQLKSRVHGSPWGLHEAENPLAIAGWADRVSTTGVM